MWEKTMPINTVREICGKVKVFFGTGAIEKIKFISKELRCKGITSVLVITGKSSYKACGAWDYVEEAFKEHGIEYLLYDKVISNPECYDIDEASFIGRSFGAKAVVAIGGGSAIDTAKGAAIMMEYPQFKASELFENKFTPGTSLPVIAINTTHGTGSEVNRFAVVTIPEKNHKTSIGYDISYPIYSIDDPKLMTSLSKEQTRYTAVDSVTHAIEACTSTLTSPYSVLLAKENLRLVDKYLPKALKNGEDLEARYYLCYSALIAGLCFDSSRLHLTHALEHPLSALNSTLPHGMGLASLLPSVAKHIYPARAQVLADVLSPFSGVLNGTIDEADRASQGIQKWLYSIGLTNSLSDLGFKESQIEALTDLVFETPSLKLLLSYSPVPASKDLIIRIYKESM